MLWISIQNSCDSAFPVTKWQRKWVLPLCVDIAGALKIMLTYPHAEIEMYDKEEALVSLLSTSQTSSEWVSPSAICSNTVQDNYDLMCIFMMEYLKSKWEKVLKSHLLYDSLYKGQTLWSSCIHQAFVCWLFQCPSLSSTFLGSANFGHTVDMHSC